MRLLLIDGELSPTFKRLDLRLHDDWVVRRAETLADFKEQCESAEGPIDLIVAYQDRPKQFSQVDLSQCISTLPLLRMVFVQGPWCDGDLRTPGRVFGPHVMRYDSAALHLAKMIEDFRLGRGLLVQPLTAQAESPIFSPNSRLPIQVLRVGIQLPKQLASGAAACVDLLGHQSIVVQNGDQIAEDIDLLLVEGDAESFESDSTTSIPRIPLCGFSRRQDHSALNKTFSLADLAAAIDQKVRSTSGQAMTRAPLISR